MANKLGLDTFLVCARNHGESPHHEDFSVEAHATDLSHLLDNLGKEKAVLVGHSMVRS